MNNVSTWAGVLVIRNKKVLTLKESNKSFLILPGGKTEGVESPEQTAVREVEEELGVGAKSLEPYLEVQETAKTTGKQMTFRLFTAELDKVPEASDLPDKTLYITWIDSNYKNEGVEVGNLLKYKALPKLKTDKLIN